MILSHLSNGSSKVARKDTKEFKRVKGRIDSIKNTLALLSPHEKLKVMEYFVYILQK